jgi:hypothetical protein
MKIKNYLKLGAAAAALCVLAASCCKDDDIIPEIPVNPINRTDTVSLKFTDFDSMGAAIDSVNSDRPAAFYNIYADKNISTKRAEFPRHLTVLHDLANLPSARAATDWGLYGVAPSDSIRINPGQWAHAGMFPIAAGDGAFWTDADSISAFGKYASLLKFDIHETDDYITKTVALAELSAIIAQIKQSNNISVKTISCGAPFDIYAADQDNLRSAIADLDALHDDGLSIAGLVLNARDKKVQMDMPTVRGIAKIGGRVSDESRFYLANPTVDDAALINSVMNAYRANAWTGFDFPENCTPDTIRMNAGIDNISGFLAKMPQNADGRYCIQNNGNFQISNLYENDLRRLYFNYPETVVPSDIDNGDIEFVNPKFAKIHCSTVGWRVLLALYAGRKTSNHVKQESVLISSNPGMYDFSELKDYPEFMFNDKKFSVDYRTLLNNAGDVMKPVRFPAVSSMTWYPNDIDLAGDENDSWLQTLPLVNGTEYFAFGYGDTFRKNYKDMPAGKKALTIPFQNFTVPAK